MRILIADDESINRRILLEMLADYADCDVVVNGLEVIEAFTMAHEQKRPYELLCLDIMMPVMDGCEALMQIRKMETVMNISPDDRVKVIMVTAVDRPNEILQSYNGDCSAYMIKPINKKALINQIKEIGLLK
ncbi:response regulator [Candidatus Magnetominusculus dajiuhuensis]|uniref:response regulator n=1 Tax=Candidatus Magnetominusculus dajiuhuensis TaxID=3137712 RepID=UPI003B43CAFD